MGSSIRNAWLILKNEGKTTVSEKHFRVNVRTQKLPEIAATRPLCGTELARAIPKQNHENTPPEPQPAIPSRAIPARDDDTPVPGSGHKTDEPKRFPRSVINPKTGEITYPGATND